MNSEIIKQKTKLLQLHAEWQKKKSNSIKQGLEVERSDEAHMDQGPFA